MKTQEVLKHAKISEILDATFLSPDSIQEAPPGFSADELDNAKSEIRTFYGESKKFNIDVHTAQNHYAEGFVESSDLTDFHISYLTGEFRLPYNECSFSLESPIEVYWSLKDHTMPSQGQQYAEHNLIGFGIRNHPYTTPEIKNHPDTHAYRCYLYFLEDEASDDMAHISWQFIDFTITEFESGRIEKPIANWVGHYQHPCSDEKTCPIERINGLPKDRAMPSKLQGACQEYINRRAIVELILSAIHEISVKEVINTHRKKTIWDYIGFSPDVGLRTADPIGDPSLPESVLPKEGYTTYLNDKRYVYPEGEIQHGTGTRHRFRYDVRRHARIVEGHIIWISPHRRGSGEYIPRVYSKKRIISVAYLVEKGQRLSRFRWIEKLMIWFIQWRRKTT